MAQNHVLDYAATLENLDENVMEQICNNYDDGDSHSIEEAKDVMDGSLMDFIQHLKHQLDIAENMRKDLKKISKSKFIAKYS